MKLPSKNQVLEVASRIAPYIKKTPILTSTQIDKMAKAELFFKCENFQKGGAYKIRGAMNAALQIDPQELKQGIATHSSGNFAQAVAIAAQELKTNAYIVMPRNSVPSKIDAVKGYGANLSLCAPTIKDRESTLAEIVSTHQATPLHPSNQMEVILGQSTVSLELIDQVEDLDYIVVPVGGGGVLAGSCLAAHYQSPNTKVIGIEPSGADDAHRSLISGNIETNAYTDTIADGLRTQLGDQNFPIIQSLVENILLVDDTDIVEAMRLIWTRMKIIVEPSSAITLAGVLKYTSLFQGKRIGLIITGGNVDLNNLPF